MNTITKSVILGQRHANYNRTVDLAKDYYAYLEGGEDMAAKIKALRKQENKEQEDIRIRVAQFRTGRAIGKIATQFQRVFRMDKEKFSVTKANDEQQAQETLLPYLSNFGKDGETLIQDVESKAMYYNLLDPNAIQWNKWNPNGQVFEPFMFSSENALYYEKTKGLITKAVLKAFMSKQAIKGNELKTYNLELFYTFEGSSLNISIKFDKELETLTSFYSTEFVDENGNPLEYEQTKIGDDVYFTYTYEMNYTELPLVQYGYIKDVQTRGETFVSLYHKGVPVLDELINTGSQKDVTQYNHTFPKLVQLYHPCDFIDGNTADQCRNGVMNISKETCPACHGTGQKTHDSGLDVIQLQAPESKDDAFIKPNEYAGYINAPIDILNVQISEVDKLFVTFSEAIFGVDLSNRPNNETATANQNYFDTAYDVLYDFTKSPVHVFVFTVRHIASQLGIDDSQYKTNLVYSSNFNLDTLHQLLLQRKIAVEAGATPETLQAIDDKILMKQNRNNPAFVKMQQAMRKFLPFGSLSEDMKMIEIANLPNSNPDKVLFMKFNQITNDIMNNEKSFVLYSYDKQKAIVEQYTQKYVEQAQQSTELTAVDRNLITEDEDE